MHVDISYRCGFFPELAVLRIVGRLSFPIFSFFIYEGFKYTHSKALYFARLFGLGMICAVVYAIYSGEVYGNVFITFSLSIAVLSAVQYLKKNFLFAKLSKRLLSVLLLIFTLLAVYMICYTVEIDYGFWGVILPLFAEASESISKRKYAALTGFSAGLVILSAAIGKVQYFSLLAIPLLASYSGRRGRVFVKYGFYIFYPLHLLIIGIIEMIIK